MARKIFQLFSNSAAGIELQFYGGEKTLNRLSLTRNKNLWQIGCAIPGGATSYSFFVDGKEVLDPSAKMLEAPRTWGEGSTKRASLEDPKPFDWQGVKRPGLSLSDLIIYEVHVRGFTQDPSSKVAQPGTFAGIREKIPYLLDLGVTAVELMPIFEFDETSYKGMNPADGTKLCNYWGYSPLSFFAPMARYSSLEDPVTELKELVRELHRAGIEVILDVVYNHSDAFLDIDAKSYYIFDEKGNFNNSSGCGNTISANEDPARELILSSLRYWATEFQVDGFRFDLASSLTRDKNGEPLAKPPLIQAIESDEALQDVKLFAEPWDPGGLYQVGSFPGGPKWSEWNGHYRDVVRRFIKGTDGQLGAFAGSLCGSEEIYEKSGFPQRSVNFITAHDGFSLRDLFSYNEKHNWENGEENRDGSDHNDSWNCGEEGESRDPDVLALRERQMKNSAVILFCSLGIPLLASGDEQGITRHGNNNPWCQDNHLTHFLWQDSPFTDFVKLLIRFRKEHLLLQRSTFLRADEIHWHGTIPHQIEWSREGRFLAATLQDLENGNQLFFAFNSFYEDLKVTIPPSSEGQEWYCVVDTQLSLQTNEPITGNYRMKAHSSLVLSSKIC